MQRLGQSVIIENRPDGGKMQLASIRLRAYEFTP
jgi:hypothetical protein